MHTTKAVAAWAVKYIDQFAAYTFQYNENESYRGYVKTYFIVRNCILQKK